MKPNTESDTSPLVLRDDFLNYFKKHKKADITLSFFDPPYNQGKDYAYFDDEQDPQKYWNWIKRVLKGIYRMTIPGGSIYFMQREKNAELILKSLRETKWAYQNMIIWRKLTSAVPGRYRFGKSYQVIVFATKGEKPKVFNRLRIDPPLPPQYKYKREKGMFATDVWDDIRELTSGYFAGDEPIRDQNGERLHKQQSPVALLTRIILSSSKPGDIVLDPTAGTGTTLVVAHQLGRTALGIEIDPSHVATIKERLKKVKPADDVSKYYKDYRFTPNIAKIWGKNPEKNFQISEFLKDGD